MRILKPIYFASVLVVALLSTARAQESATVQRSTLTITANASGDWVRITAPSSVVQMHVEVYAASGEKLFDQEIRGGNVFDWHLQDGQGQRLAAGAYVCVVTAKSVSGKLTQKIGAVTVAENSVNVQPADSQQLSVQQSQAIGPIEDNSSWTIPGKDEPQTPTVIAHDGTDGQMIRGRGALTFRIGNFFSGIDQEQMRLTEAGNLGIGTSQPQAKLDVAGTVRAERFVIGKPNKSGGDKTAAGASDTNAADSVQPLTGGSGITGQVTKWTDGANGTLGDSVITEAADGSVGINTTAPGGKLHIVTAANTYVLRTSGGSLETFLHHGSTTGTWFTNTLGGFTFNNQLGPLVFAANNAEAMRITNNGNVGFSKAVPEGRLHIGTAANTYALRTSGGGLETYLQHGATSGTWYTNSTGGFTINNQAGPLVFAANNAEVMRFTNTGNVGIGTTPNATTKLDVAGDINTSTGFNIGGNRVLIAPGLGNVFAGKSAGNIAGSGFGNSFFGFFSGLNNIQGSSNTFLGEQTGLNNQDGSFNTFVGESAGLNNQSGGANVFIGAFSGGANLSGQSNTLIGYHANVGGSALTNATAIGVAAQVSQSNALVLGSINGVNGSTLDTSVGIGTSSPANPLDVNGVGTQSGGVGGFSEVAARFRNRTAGTHSALSIDALSGQDSILYLAENGAAVWGIRNDSDQGGKFQIRLQSGGVNTPLFSLNPTGEVGLGTTTPNATLQVISTTTEQVLSATSNLTTGTYFNLGNTGTSGNTWNFISTGTADSQGGPGKLYIKDNNAGLVRAAFDTKGNLGIGTTAPNAKLHVVNGDAAITTQSFGIILRATDGPNCYRLTVNNAGTLSTFALSCP